MDFDINALVRDPGFQMGLGILGASNPRQHALTNAYQILNQRSQFEQKQKMDAANLELEKKKTDLYGQQVQQTAARTAQLERENAQRQQQFEMGMKLLHQMGFGDLATSIQPPTPVQTPQGPAMVPGPVNPQPAQQVMSTGKHGTPNLILDNLMKTESGGNPLAVGPPIGGPGGPRALGPFQFTPDTIKELKADGITFDPFNVGQSRDAADYLLQKRLKANGGDWNKAIASYGGFASKDPTEYIAKVTAGFTGSPEKQAQASQNLSQTQAQLAQLNQQAQNAKRQQQAAGVLRFMFGDAGGLSEAAKAGAPDYEPAKLGLQAQGQAQTAAHQAEQTDIERQRVELERRRVNAEEAAKQQTATKAQNDRAAELASMKMGHEKIADAMTRGQAKIDELLNSPGLDSIIGRNAMTNKLTELIGQGTPAYGALTKLKSIESGLVNDLLQSVREGKKNNASGYGSFTEKELEVLKTYIENLDPASPTFKQDLQHVRSELGRLREQSGRFLEEASGGELKPRVRIRKGGKEFTVPANQLDEALKSGYERVQ